MLVYFEGRSVYFRRRSISGAGSSWVIRVSSTRMVVLEGVGTFDLRVETPLPDPSICGAHDQNSRLRCSDACGCECVEKINEMVHDGAYGCGSAPGHIDVAFFFHPLQGESEGG